MAEEKITSDQLIEKGIFEDAKKQAKDLDSLIVILTKSMEELVKVQKDGLANIKKIGGANDSKSLKATSEELKKVTEARKASEELDKKKIYYEKLFEAQRKKERADFEKKQKDDAKALVDAEKASKQKEKELKQLAEQNRAYNIASKRLNELRKEYKDLAISGQDNTKAAQDMLKEIKLLDAELKEVDESVGQFNRSVGDYKNQVKEAINESDLFTKSLGGLSESNQIIVQSFSKMQTALNGLNGKLGETRSGLKKVGLSLKAAGIGLLITALASVGAYFKSSREGGQQFALIMARISATISVLVGNLSAAGAGIVGLGVAVKQFFSGDFTEASNTASESIDKIKKAFDGTVERIDKTVDATVELTKETFEFENALRRLNLTLLKSNLDEEDFNEIAGDTTRTLKEQKAALQDAIKARLVSAQISAKIAQTEENQAFKAAIIKLRTMKVSEEELALIKKQGAERLVTSKLADKLDEDQLNALNEKVKANITAQDALADLPRQEAQRQRDQIQKETEYQIELTRSKKLAASSQIAILTKQVSDENEQLEARRKFREELNAAEIATQENQFALFNKGIEEENKINAKGDAELKQRVDFRALVATQDEVILAQKIRGLKLSEAQQIQVAKVVKEAQVSEIANNELIAKQDKEELDRKEKIAQIDREILAIQKQSELDAVSSVKTDRAKELQEQNNIILQGENSYNRKLLSERRATFEITKELTDKEFDLKKKQLEDLAANDVLNIKTVDLKIRAEEELKIKAKLEADKLKLETDRIKQTTDLLEKEKETNTKIRIEQTEIALKQLETITSAVQEGLQQRESVRAKEADREIAQTEKNLDRQERLAEQGKENSLAFEKKKLEEQNLARREAEEKAAKIARRFALVQQFNGFLQSALKETPTPTGTQAILSATKNTALSAGIAEAFQYYEDGGLLEGPSHKEGGIKGTGKFANVEAEGGEFIVNKKATAKNLGILEKINDGVDVSQAINWMPKLDALQMIEKQNSIAQTLQMQNILANGNKKVESLLTELLNKPVQRVDVEGIGRIIETVYKDGVKYTTTHVLSTKKRTF